MAVITQTASGNGLEVARVSIVLEELKVLKILIALRFRLSAYGSYLAHWGEPSSGGAVPSPLAFNYRPDPLGIAKSPEVLIWGTSGGLEI